MEKIKSLNLNYLWIGATASVASKSKDGFKFVNGEIINVDDWHSGEPSGDGVCVNVFIRGPGLGLNDASCDAKTIFICEVSTNTGR